MVGHTKGDDENVGFPDGEKVGLLKREEKTVGQEARAPVID